MQASNYDWEHLFDTLNIQKRVKIIFKYIIKQIFIINKKEFVQTIVNLVKLGDIMNSVSSISFSDVKRNALEYQKTINIFIIMIFLIIFLLSILSYTFILKYNHLKQKIFNLFRYCDRISLEEDILRIQQSVQNHLQQDRIIPLANFSFHLEEKEEYLTKIQQKKEKIIKKYKLDKKQNDLKIEIPRLFNKYTHFLLLLSVVGINIGCLIYICFYNINFIDKYIAISNRYQNIVDHYSILSRLFCLKEFAFSISSGGYSYQNKNDLEDIKVSFDMRMNQFEQFFLTEIAQIGGKTQENSIDDIQNYIKFLSFANQNNICSDVIHLSGYFLELCNRIQGQTLQKGLIQGISRLINDLKSDRQSKGFDNYKRNPMFPNGDQIEASLFIGRILKYSSDILYNDLQNLCSNSWQTIFLIMTIYSCMVFLVNTGLFIFGLRIFQREFSIVKKSILLLPLSTLYLENSFQSNIKFIYTKFNLLDD